MRRILGLLFLLTVVGGCGQSSFIGTRFDNFTAYYNKFFNARKAFERGVEALEERDTRINRDRYLPLFINPDAAASSSEFQATIKKSADVLREHPDSKWVDDALLLIGKSYFYQRNYVGAEQKFLEVIALDTHLGDEARFWLARTLITGGNYDEAARSLTESLNRENISRRWKPMMLLALGELNVQRGDWPAAAETLSEGLASVRDNDLGARAQFLLGQVYETIGDYEKAVAAYDRVERFRPLYELSYAAKLSAVRVLGSYLDEEAALRELRRMERDDKHYQYRNELAYTRGRIYQKQGHADDAFLLYDDILYDSDGDVSAVRGKIHYALGELYRDFYRDYLTASAHFDTAATALATAPAGGAGAQSAREERFTPEAISDASEQKEMFASFSEVMYRIHEMDSLLYLGSLEPEAFEEAILAVRQQLAAEMEEQRRELERRQASQAFRDVGAAEAARERGSVSAVSGAGSEAGFLYHQDPMLVEEARLNFQAVWGERPLVPNWRRRDAVDDYLASSDGGVDADSALADLETTGDQLPPVDLSAIPRDSLGRAEMRADRAAASYELANVLFLSMNRPDSAAVWYRKVIEDASDSTLIQRAYYALAEVQRAIGDTEAADALYENVLEISETTNLARQLSQRLGRATTAQADGDTLAAATRAYDRAYSRWQLGNHRSALSEMIELAARYPETEVAPKALMAAGTIYAEWARQDSLDLFGGIPVTLPDSLLAGIGLATHRTRTVPDTTQQRGAPDLRITGDSLAADTDSLLAAPDAAIPNALSDSLSTAGEAESAPAADSLQGVRPLEEIASSDSASASQAGPAPATTPGAGPPADSLAATATTAPVASADSADTPTTAQRVSADSTETTPASPMDSPLDADSLRGRQMAAAVDSIIVEEFDPISLDRLYASIATRYADSPFAERARRIREALAERQAEQARADSIAIAIADSLLGATLFADSVALPGDSLDLAPGGGDTALDSLTVRQNEIDGPPGPEDAVAPDSLQEDDETTPADSAGAPTNPDLRPPIDDEVPASTDPPADDSLLVPRPGETRQNVTPPADSTRQRPRDDAATDSTAEPVY